MTEKELKKLSDEKLIEEHEATYQSIYVIGCYGVRDMMLLMSLENELQRRGYEYSETPHWNKNK